MGPLSSFRNVSHYCTLCIYLKHWFLRVYIPNPPSPPTLVTVMCTGPVCPVFDKTCLLVKKKKKKKKKMKKKEKTNEKSKLNYSYFLKTSIKNLLKRAEFLLSRWVFCYTVTHFSFLNFLHAGVSVVSLQLWLHHVGIKKTNQCSKTFVINY